jgi:hypothetical protein
LQSKLAFEARLADCDPTASEAATPDIVKRLIVPKKTDRDREAAFKSQSETEKKFWVSHGRGQMHDDLAKVRLFVLFLA